MRIVLSSFANAWRFARFDPETGAFSRIPLALTLLRRPGTTAGWYVRSGRELAALFVVSGRLYFRHGKTAVEITEHSRAVLERRGRKGWLEISSGGEHVVFEYRLPRLWPPLSEDPTPFVQEEDFDFGLFVHNVVKDPARGRRIIETRESSV